MFAFFKLTPIVLSATEYKGINYQVLQGANQHEWKWTVFLDANSASTGTSRTRSVAIVDASRAIQNTKKRTEGK